MNRIQRFFNRLRWLFRIRSKPAGNPVISDAIGNLEKDQLRVVAQKMLIASMHGVGHSAVCTCVILDEDDYLEVRREHELDKIGMEPPTQDGGFAAVFGLRINYDELGLNRSHANQFVQCINLSCDAIMKIIKQSTNIEIKEITKQ